MGGAEFVAHPGFMIWNRVGAIEITTHDCSHAMRFPVLGWPTKRLFFGVGGPGTHLTRRIFDTETFRNSPASHALILQRGTGPSSAALGETIATIAPQYECGLLTGRRGEESPPNGTHYEARRLPGCRINGRLNIYWGMESRLGPLAIGATTNFRATVRGAPRLMRKTSIHESAGSPRACGQFVRPPTMYAAA